MKLSLLQTGYKKATLVRLKNAFGMLIFCVLLPFGLGLLKITESQLFFKLQKSR